MMDKKIQLSIYGILAVLFIATSLFITAPVNTISAGTITGAQTFDLSSDNLLTGRVTQADGSTTPSSDARLSANARSRYLNTLPAEIKDKVTNRKQGVTHTIGEVQGLPEALTLLNERITTLETTVEALKATVEALTSVPVNTIAPTFTTIAPTAATFTTIAPPNVIVCKEPNLGSPCRNIYDQIDNVGSDWNDQISSIKVTPGFVATFCNDENAGGYCFTVDENHPATTGYTLYNSPGAGDNQNNIITSIYYEALPPPGSIKLCSGYKYLGQCDEYSPTSNPQGAAAGLINVRGDVYSSVLLGAGTRVKLCPDYSGNVNFRANLCVLYTASSPHLLNGNLDDKIDSIQFLSSTTPAGSTLRTNGQSCNENPTTCRSKYCPLSTGTEPTQKCAACTSPTQCRSMYGPGGQSTCTNGICSA